MRRLALFFTTMASCPVFAGAPACTPGDAKVVVESLLAATLAADCESELGAIGASAYWMEECKGRAVMLDSAMRVEFARRTSFVFKELLAKDNATYAVVTFHGPKQFDYQWAVARENFCRPRDNIEGALHTFSEGVTGCGEAFWASIPVVEYLGAVPISCVDSGWVVQDPE